MPVALILLVVDASEVALLLVEPVSTAELPGDVSKASADGVDDAGVSWVTIWVRGDPVTVTIEMLTIWEEEDFSLEVVSKEEVVEEGEEVVVAVVVVTGVVETVDAVDEISGVGLVTEVTAAVEMDDSGAEEDVVSA